MKKFWRIHTNPLLLLSKIMASTSPLHPHNQLRPITQNISWGARGLIKAEYAFLAQCAVEGWKWISYYRAKHKWLHAKASIFQVIVPFAK